MGSSRTLIFLLVSLLLTMSSLADDLSYPEIFQSVHARIWEMDDAVCRHAAVAVYDLAVSSGLPAMVMRFQTMGNKNHVVPVVFFSDENLSCLGRWVAFESICVTDEFKIHCSKASRRRGHKTSWSGIVSFDDRRVLNKMIGAVNGDDLLKWRRELEQLRAFGTAKKWSSMR